MTGISGFCYPAIIKLKSSTENKSFIKTIIGYMILKECSSYFYLRKKIVNKNFISSNYCSNEVFLYMEHWDTIDLEGPPGTTRQYKLRQQGHPPVLRC